MFTEQAFQDAEKQGYMCVNRIVAYTAATEFKGSEIETDRDYYYTLGDPEFWKALGLARGWKDPNLMAKWITEEGTGLIIFHNDGSWAAWQHRYVDHAIEHGYNDHEAFFKQLYPPTNEPAV